MNKLSFHFRVNELNGWPKIRFVVDNTVILDHCFTATDQTVDLSLNIDAGPHVLEIQRYGKTDQNVLFDSATYQIISDQIVELLGISVDDVELPMFFLYRGVWRWEQRQEPSSLYWGPNGTWIWSFETPLVDWAIRQNRQHQDSHLDLLSPYKDDLSLSYKYLDQLEEAILEVDKKNSTGK